MTQPKAPLQGILCLSLSLLFFHVSVAQAPEEFGTTEILQKLHRLSVLGTVLYVAAHPDDENTSVISYFANKEHIRTGYLSATRGDGGQNLIGTEIRELLGVIRTQELLAARRIDLGEQFFSRAVDFGYSKYPDETFNKWERDEVLADFVRVIRKFKPDVIITRFNTQPGITHGHHTASAILAKEAFELSGDPAAFPEQLDELSIWQPSKIFWNTSWWFFRRTGQKFDTTGLKMINVGEFSPTLGTSYTEISARSRSMHKSQGFGVSASRGDQFEYFKDWGTEKQPGDILSGIDMSWGRVEGGEGVAYFINEVKANFDPMHPYSIVEDLLSARKSILALDNQHWKSIKLAEIDELIGAVTGSFLSLVTDQETFAIGDSLTIQGEFINRSPVEMSLSSIDFNISDETMLVNQSLSENQPNQLSFDLVVPKNVKISQPYWLLEEARNGMFSVSDPSLIGKPENDAAISARVTIKVVDQFIDFDMPVRFNNSDPVEGEQYKPIHLTPPVMVIADQEVLIFGDNEEKPINVEVLAGKSNVSGQVFLELPEGWKSSPESYDFNLQEKGNREGFDFMVSPSKKQGQYTIRPTVTFEGKEYCRGMKSIEYDHIPRQILYPSSDVEASRIDLETGEEKIGYFIGAGDLVPDALQEIGYQVDLLNESDLSTEKLEQYDAIILGVRAFNTLDWLASKNTILFEYAKLGGTLIVQYNTTSRMVTRDLAPYDLNITRGRVSVEESPVRILDPSDPVLNYPNKITLDDFDGWVQERGLYFPDSWGQELRPVFSMNDPGENPMDGSLLIGRYGEGNYVYTSLSFFRELPAGVPGAYRLLVNLISLGSKKEQ